MKPSEHSSRMRLSTRNEGDAAPSSSVSAGRTPAEPVPEAELGRADEIAGIAMQLFLERGYDNTPMALIARAAGLTKAGLYHHFESKEEILYAVHKTGTQRNLLPILERAEPITDPEQRLRTFLLEHARQLTRDPTAAVQITEARRLSRKHFKEIQDCWKRSYELVRGAIVELQQQGRCAKHVNPAYAAFAALGSTSWIVHWFDYSRPMAGEEVARTVVEIFIKGLLAAEQT
jgi:AcrR family transcriptional regulator